jgi:hypothetical protein
MKNSIVAKHYSRVVVFVFLSSFFLHCDFSPGTVGGGSGALSGGGGDKSSAVVMLPDANFSRVDGGTPGLVPTSDANCGQQTSETTKGQTDVLLVLDRSGSMNESIAADCCCSSTCRSAISIKMCSDSSNCSERWPALSAAVSSTIASTTGVNWGLKLFSSPKSLDVCAVNSGVEVPIGASTSASAIETQISGASPLNATPTAKAVTAATAYLKTVADQNNKVILLSTDGEPNCKPGSLDTSVSDVDGTTAAIQAALAAGFRVYVIGIGPSVGNLDGFARAGGTDHYYPATSAAQLSSALAAISNTLASCTFAMSQTPPVLDNIAVYLDGKLVDQDVANGWSFGTTTDAVMLNGTACDRIKSGTASKVQVLFGCPGTSLPPPTLY